MIPQNPLWHKALPYLDRLLIPGIILTVGIAAFGLGRLSAGQGKGHLVIRQAETAAPAAASTATSAAAPSAAAGESAGSLVASKNGSKYYLPACAGAKTIKPENQVWFGSVAEAQAAGYTAAANCKGI